MISPTHFLSDTIAEIFATASATRMLKYSEYNLLTTVFNASLDKQDLSAIHRLLHFVKKGQIQLVNDFSQSYLAA